MTDVAVTLVPLAREYLPMTLAWRNRPEVRRWFKHSDEVSSRDHAAWFERYLQKEDDKVFVVCAAGQPVGQVAIYNIDQVAGMAEIGRFIAAPESRGRGYIRQGIDQMLRFGRDDLGITLFYLEVMSDNATALALYARLGFRETARREGLIRMEVAVPEAGVLK